MWGFVPHSTIIYSVKEHPATLRGPHNSRTTCTHVSLHRPSGCVKSWPASADQVATRSHLVTLRRTSTFALRQSTEKLGLC